jgi:hypothetical protein
MAFEFYFDRKSIGIFRQNSNQQTPIGILQERFPIGFPIQNSDKIHKVNFKDNKNILTAIVLPAFFTGLS